MEYLEFETPIKVLVDKIEQCKELGDQTQVDVTETCDKLKKKLEETKKEIYSQLTAWQRVQLSLHFRLYQCTDRRDLYGIAWRSSICRRQSHDRWDG